MAVRCPNCGKVNSVRCGQCSELITIPEAPKPVGFTAGDLAQMLSAHAKRWAPEAGAWVLRNAHQADPSLWEDLLTKDGEWVIPRAVSDAVIVGFVNSLMVHHGVDMALEARDLPREGTG